MVQNQADNIRDIKKLKALAADLTVLIYGEKKTDEEEKEAIVYESTVEKWSIDFKFSI